MHHGFDGEAACQIPPMVFEVGKGCGIGRAEKQPNGIEQRGLPDVPATENDIHPGLRMPFELLYAPKSFNPKTVNNRCDHVWAREVTGCGDFYATMSRLADPIIRRSFSKAAI